MTTILVVDDEEPVVNLLADVFEEQGYTVRVAYNGRTALEIVRENPPDLVVSDIMMPFMDGVTFCRILQAESDIPVILMSAAPQPNFASIGARAFIPKPFTLDQMDTLVGQVLAERG